MNLSMILNRFWKNWETSRFYKQYCLKEVVNSDKRVPNATVSKYQIRTAWMISKTSSFQYLILARKSFLQKLKNWNKHTLWSRDKVKEPRQNRTRIFPLNLNRKYQTFIIFILLFGCYLVNLHGLFTFFMLDHQ